MKKGGYLPVKRIRSPDREALDRLRGRQVLPSEPAPRARDLVAAEPAIDPFVAMIERVVANPAVDADKLSKIIDAQERVMAINARRAFDAAFVEMQPELPVITRDGRIVVREKDDRGRRTGEKTQDTPYAKWETIDEIVKPILHRHGFALSHRISTAPPDETKERRVRVTAILRGHGHVEDDCYFDLMADSTGSKNNAQAWASSVSYAKRHTGVAVLNIITKAEDDDGKSSGKPMVVGDTITPEHLFQLRDMIDAVECPLETYINHLNNKKPRNHPDIDDLSSLPDSRFEEAIAHLRLYEQNKKGRDAARGTR